MLVQVMPPNLKAKAARWPLLGEALDKIGEGNPMVSTQLSELTYLETQQLVARLRSEMPAAEMARKIETAWENGTLNRLNEVERVAQPARGSGRTVIRLEAHSSRLSASAGSTRCRTASRALRRRAPTRHRRGLRQRSIHRRRRLPGR